MRKIFLAAALVLLGSLQASGVTPKSKAPPVKLGVPLSGSYSLLGPLNGEQVRQPTTEIPSTPLQIAPSPLHEPSTYAEKQGVLGPAAQSNMGFTLGLPIGNSVDRRGTHGREGPPAYTYAQRMNSR